MKTSVTKNFKCCWWILTVWLSAVPIFLQCLLVYETNDLKTKKKPEKKETITLRCSLIRKKDQFPRFPNFRFCPLSKIENLEILESFVLLKFLVVYETQNLKNDIKEKNIDFMMWFEKKKCPFARFSGFRFCPMLKSKTWKLWKVFVYVYKFLSFWLQLAWKRLKPFIEFQVSRPYVLKSHNK